MKDILKTVLMQAKRAQMLILFVVCLGLLVSFLYRFPRNAQSLVIQPWSIETYFNTGWEIDSAGGYVWVLDQKNTIVIANNKDVGVRGKLDIQILGSPCGGSHQVIASGKSFPTEILSVKSNQPAQIQLELTFGRYERVSVGIYVMGPGCSPSASDGRLLKVQIRQPSFTLQ